MNDIVDDKQVSKQQLTMEEENALENKLVWVVGSPRSGSTWLTHKLLKHPDNVLWNEPLIGHHLGVLQLQQNVVIVEQNRLIDRRGETLDYFFSLQHKSCWIPTLRKLILARAHSVACSLTKNVLIKEPNGSKGMDIIMEVLPRSKMCFLLRDGRDVIDSMIGMHSLGGWANLQPFASKQERFNHIELFAQMWMKNTEVVLNAYHNHDSSLRILVKYEDLRTNTFTELKSIYNFLSIRVSDEELHATVEQYDFNNIPELKQGKGKFNRTARVGGWKDNFDEKEKKLMNSIMGDRLSELGYDV